MPECQNCKKQNKKKQNTAINESQHSTFFFNFIITVSIFFSCY